ncbi:hypothetical protein [Qingshengfaniella alkalisoli]|uniref:Uncharacterized protein n=1 Tax=Qingshengfaniella alkalisoli TaxID=2599296 RepID=A0A5B8IZT5_9RHOB|nr:hypothetical protein [Qingshengfaniella alkalisoli]QDY70128.1 hypothetical protein FPZ52_11180 [Qingshengfaniella alkalisoli]
MTLDELRQAWIRWMHRKDVQADLAAVEAFALEHVRDRLMLSDVPDVLDDEAVAAMPGVWLHAGLVSLHELAQDDEGLTREMQMFEEAVANRNRRYSIDRGPAVMCNPWYEGAS